MKENFGTELINPIPTQQIFGVAGINVKNNNFTSNVNEKSKFSFYNKPSVAFNTSELYACTRPVNELLKDQVNNSEDGNAFFVCDIGQVVRQHMKWKSNLPRVEPYYAIKCNSDPNVLKALVSMGTGFDCASKGEMKTMLSYGVPPHKIIYANPCKQKNHIKFAADNGIELMTFDNSDELYKIKAIHPNAKMVLRVLTDDTYSLCRFSLKFGATPSSAYNLLKLAKELGINVVGVSFHVGSGCFNASAFKEAVLVARQVFDIGEKLGFDFNLLDVGGGFPGSDSTDISFDEVAEILGSSIDEYFPKKVRVIAEPGRYYVASAFTLATQIISRRAIKRDSNEEVASNVSGNDDHPSYMYYINDGVYASFNCILFDHQHAHPKALCKDGHFYLDHSNIKRNTIATYSTESESSCSESETEVEAATEFNCSVWGPTCDSLDCITKNCILPALEIGDWLYFEEMGAYTICAASEFNGFRRSNIVYTNTETRSLNHIIHENEKN